MYLNSIHRNLVRQYVKKVKDEMFYYKIFKNDFDKDNEVYAINQLSALRNYLDYRNVPKIKKKWHYNINDKTTHKYTVLSPKGKVVLNPEFKYDHFDV